MISCWMTPGRCGVMLYFRFLINYLEERFRSALGTCRCVPPGGKANATEEEGNKWAGAMGGTDMQTREGKWGSCLLPAVVNMWPLMDELISEVESCFFKMSGLPVGPSSFNRPPPSFHGTCLHHSYSKQQHPVFKGEFSGVRQTVKFQECNFP